MSLMNDIRTARLLLRPFRESDYDGLRREAHFRQNNRFRKDAAGEPVWKDTYVYAVLSSDVREA